MLGEVVRDRGLLSLEEAVHMMTNVPAALYGLRDRGRVAEGVVADLVVFDPATIATEPARCSTTSPAAVNGSRPTRAASTVSSSVGTEIVVEGVPTGARPGVVLRSGIATETVTLAMARGAVRPFRRSRRRRS